MVSWSSRYVCIPRQVSLCDTMSQSLHRDITLFPVKRITYPYERSTVFTSTLPEASGRSRKNSVSSRSKPNGDNGDNKVEMVEDLHIVDYRHSRFALDTRTGLFTIIRSVLRFSAPYTLLMLF